MNSGYSPMIFVSTVSASASLPRPTMILAIE